MASHYHGSKISGSQQFFFKEMATMEKKHGLSSFAPECNHAHESHSNYSNQVRYLLQHRL